MVDFSISVIIRRISAMLKRRLRTIYHDNPETENRCKDTQTEISKSPGTNQNPIYQQIRNGLDPNAIESKQLYIQNNIYL